MPFALEEPKMNTFALKTAIDVLGDLVLDDPDDVVYLAILLTASGLDFRRYSYPVGIVPSDVSWDGIFGAGGASQGKTEMPELVLLAVKAFGSIMRFNFEESHTRITLLERQILSNLEESRQYLQLVQNLWHFRYCIAAFLEFSLKKENASRTTIKDVFRDMRYWERWTELFWLRDETPNMDEEAAIHFLDAIGRLSKQFEPGKFAPSLEDMRLPRPHMEVIEAENLEAMASYITLDDNANSWDDF
ncbi:hypothetical protein PSACC_02313 [Paramicrosporidium saccamoebae]|uniref:Uncharacterized protein n=1 Tax=Paramicrosporidium saccamoebae TaxID=1246581 RepID=A0A2H9TJE8_9FUNG|nr:hypothetical protein PSACC_02313 [Paramicrosporidium saccamoebae]